MPLNTSFSRTSVESRRVIAAPVRARWFLALFLLAASVGLDRYSEEALYALEDDTDLELSIDINAAGFKELEAVPGIGVKTAERIIYHRSEIGRFDDLDDLLAVRGIGPYRLREIGPYIRLGTTRSVSGSGE